MARETITTGKVKTVSLVLPSLHKRQRDFVMDPHRIVVAACGTKFGKTWGLSNACILDAWNNQGHLVWWVAPTYKQAQIAYDLMGRLLPSSRVKTNKTDMSYSLMSGGREWSRIEFRSADNEESLRGSGVHLAIIDEAAYVKDAAFVSVWTTLTRTRGKLRAISTPKGRGTWFYDEWSKGWFPEMREKHPEYMSYQLPTWDNPYVPRESIEEFRRNMPSEVFRQEVEAQFLDESAGVFKNIRACQTAEWRNDPEPGELYVMGVDWAKLHDYTVFTIANRRTKHVCHIVRINELDWNIQIKLAIDTARKWNNAKILMDATGVGDVPLDSVRSVYSNAEGYVIGNNKSKVALIQRLQLSLENKEIGIPPARTNIATEMLDHELAIYEYSLSTSGNFIFSAPEGRNDDCVISLALANWEVSQEPLVYRGRSVRGI